MKQKTLDAFAKLANDPSTHDKMMSNMNGTWKSGAYSKGEYGMIDYMTGGKW